MSVGWMDAGFGTPARLGMYRIGEMIGRGSTGIVYRAFDSSGEAVALKTVHRATSEAFANLRAEVHALRCVHHHGIVGVLSNGEDAGRPWFAMELLVGETLATRARSLHRSTWTRAELRPIVELVAAICEPLAALHACGLVHRDLKPDNIFLRQDGRPVIVDLGLAHRGGGETRAVIEARAMAGTFAYMAPEQLAGGLGDARTDLYALGCILYELLVGAPPTEEDALPVRNRVAGIPAELDALVTSMLQRRPRDRIGHADDVRRWLATHLETRSAQPERTTHALYRPVLAGRRDLLHSLLARLEAARAARGAVVVLAGESGIGKTHLASELGRIAAQDGTVFALSAHPADGAAQTPLACWTPVFDHAVDRALVEPSSGVASILKRDRALVDGLHRAFDRLPSLAAPRHASPSADEVVAFVLDLVGAIAADRPTLILVDDLQWADELTLQIVRRIAGSWSRRRRILVIATLRSDEAAPELPESTARFDVGPLAVPEVRELVAEMLGVTEAPVTITDWIARHADGNPFLVAEYLRLVLSDVELERELALPTVSIRAPAPGALDRLQTPANVRELVLRRLRKLGDAAFALAELIAVMGGALDGDVVAALTAVRPDVMFELDRAQILDREPESECTRRLAHDRIRVALLGQIDAGRLGRLHHEAAELLESCERDPAHDAIAYHFIHAGDPARALPHLEEAAQVALARAAYDAAATHFAELARVVAALEVAGHVFTASRRAKWSLGAARASYFRGDSSGCEDHVRAALALVGRTLPNRRAGWALLTIREALASQRSGPADDPGLFGDAALAASLLPYRYFFAEDLVPLVASALLAANLARRAGAYDHAAAPRSLLAAMAGLCRLSGVARRNFDAAAAAAERNHDWREAAQARALESIYEGSFGRMSEAELAAQRALAYCDRTPDPWVRENAETTYSHVAYYTGRIDDARRRAEWVARSAHERGNLQHEIWGLFLQARSDVAAASWRSAETLLREALKLFDAAPELLSELATRGLLARVLLALGDREQAELHASWVTAQVRERSPSAYPSLIAYTSTAEVWRHLLAEPTRHREREARGLALALWRFAALYPIALPPALVHSSFLLERAGLHGLSARCAAAATRRVRNSHSQERH
ncbi:MAG: AAA family ATPase [Kofleriaceae bacterium]